MHESITLQMVQFFFLHTELLGNGNSKFRLWKQLKNLQKNCESFPPRKKNVQQFWPFLFWGKKVLLCYMYFTKHLLYLVFPNLVCKTWNTDAKFLRPTGQLSEVTKSSTGQHQWSPNFGVIYPVTRPTGCLLSQFWRNFCPKAIQSKSVDVALHLWAKKKFGKPLIMN